jgi:F0F1-type ATP synthase assembly protein I
MQGIGFSEPSNMKHYVQALGMGFTIVSLVCLGAVVGYFLDRFFNTEPLLVIIGIIIGTGSSFVFLYQLSMRK